MRNTDTLNEYKLFIFEKATDKHHELPDYSLLLNTLFNIPFRSYVPRDDNRIEDAIDMREDFSEEIFGEDRYYESVMDRYVSAFEVLLALAIRMEKDILCDPMSGIDHSTDHFWTFLRNLGIEKYTNDNFSEAIVRDKCEKWIHRTYQKDGTGGIFPLKKCKNDVRKMEIWGQMNMYIYENY